MAVQPKIQVEGLREFQRVVRQVKDREVTKAVTEANKAAAQIVVDDAKPYAPRRSGRLANSVKAVNSARYSAVRAGTGKTVPYAGPIHYGWPARGIRPRPFLTVGIAKKSDEIRTKYEDGLRKVVALLEAKGLTK